jgi:hypothetical protein
MLTCKDENVIRGLYWWSKCLAFKESVFFSFVWQSRSVRDFDNYATRILGKFEVKADWSSFSPKWLILSWLTKTTVLFLRLLMHITGVLVVWILWEMYLCLFCASVPWMIQFVQGRPSHGMNAGRESASLLFPTLWSFERVICSLFMTFLNAQHGFLYSAISVAAGPDWLLAFLKPLQFGLY